MSIKTLKQRLLEKYDIEILDLYCNLAATESGEVDVIEDVNIDYINVLGIKTSLAAPSENALFKLVSLIEDDNLSYIEDEPDEIRDTMLYLYEDDTFSLLSTLPSDTRTFEYYTFDGINCRYTYVSTINYSGIEDLKIVSIGDKTFIFPDKLSKNCIQNNLSDEYHSHKEFFVDKSIISDIGVGNDRLSSLLDLACKLRK